MRYALRHLAGPLLALALPGLVAPAHGGPRKIVPAQIAQARYSRGGQAGAQLWRVQHNGGLWGTPPKAFDELRADVERSPAQSRP